MGIKHTKEIPKKHYCKKHNLEAHPMALGFKFKIRYVCAKGCNATRQEVTVR